MYCPNQKLSYDTENKNDAVENYAPTNSYPPTPSKLSKGAGTAVEASPSITEVRETLSLFTEGAMLISPADFATQQYQRNVARVQSNDPIVLGVKQIWVNSKWRRRGVARTLLECSRTSASKEPRCPLFINAQEKFKIAFSQPTSDGLHCALHYVSPSRFLWVYSRSTVNSTTTQDTVE